MIFCKIVSDSLFKVKIEIMLKSRSNNHIILQFCSTCVVVSYYIHVKLVPGSIDSRLCRSGYKMTVYLQRQLQFEFESQIDTD